MSNFRSPNQRKVCMDPWKYFFAVSTQQNSLSSGESLCATNYPYTHTHTHKELKSLWAHEPNIPSGYFSVWLTCAVWIPCVLCLCGRKRHCDKVSVSKCMFDCISHWRNYTKEVDRWMIGSEWWEFQNLIILKWDEIQLKRHKQRNKWFRFVKALDCSHSAATQCSASESECLHLGSRCFGQDWLFGHVPSLTQSQKLNHSSQTDNWFCSWFFALLFVEFLPCRNWKQNHINRDIKLRKTADTKHFKWTLRCFHSATAVTCFEGFPSSPPNLCNTRWWCMLRSLCREVRPLRWISYHVTCLGFRIRICHEYEIKA